MQRIDGFSRKQIDFCQTQKSLWVVCIQPQFVLIRGSRLIRLTGFEKRIAQGFMQARLMGVAGKSPLVVPRRIVPGLALAQQITRQPDSPCSLMVNSRKLGNQLLCHLQIIMSQLKPSFCTLRGTGKKRGSEMPQGTTIIALRKITLCQSHLSFGWWDLAVMPPEAKEWLWRVGRALDNQSPGQDEGPADQPARAALLQVRLPPDDIPRVDGRRDRD